MENQYSRTIPVTIDKSHLITIGERLYAHSLELIRELVSNSYDADATHVWIELEEFALTVKDNGSGMDEAGLVQFFNIGSTEKRFNKKSPKFSRIRIGEFGIGKFSVLAACDVFKVYTQKGNFAARLTFDKNLWNSMEDWEVPIHFVEANKFSGDGTTVVLERLKKALNLPDIERFIRERVPLKVPNFSVFLNGKKINPTIIPGRKFLIDCDCVYGKIYGEVLIPNFSFKNSSEEKGVECFVNDVFIKREMFGFEFSHLSNASRLMGEVHADFLPITSDRSRFITDANEYELFYKIMRQEIQQILKELKEQAGLKEIQKADGVIKDALSHIRKALKKNPEFAGEVSLPVNSGKQLKNEEIFPDFGEESKGAEDAARDAISGEGHSSSEVEDEFGEKIDEFKTKPERTSKKIKVRTLTGRAITARKMEVGNFSVVCQSEELGENNLPVVSEAGIIFINRDHPLYRRFQKNLEALTLFVTELIAQEIAKQKSHDLKEAFELQNKILTDAWS